MTRVAMVLALALWSAGPAMTDEIRPGVFRTPDERFQNLPDFPFAPHYAEVSGYRMHYLDEGPANGDVILLLHGEPTWCFLYRKMIPDLVKAGHRCIVPDLIGFGRSDKPADMKIHTYKFHVDAIAGLVEQLGLKGVTFFGQDWGGLIGLRVVAEHPERFARVVISNTGLPTGDLSPGQMEAFMKWKAMSQGMIDRGDIPVGTLVSGSIGNPSLAAAYDAPFPDAGYKAGPLILPQRVPVTPDDPAREANLRAWEVFRKWDRPFLCAFGDSDPITRGGDAAFREQVPGAKGQAHTTIAGGSHFIQEQKGPELAKVINDFIAATAGGVKRTAGLNADDIPVAHTPAGFWKTMPAPVLDGCTEALVAGAPDLRGLWEVSSATLNGKASDRGVGMRQRIEQCGNRIVIMGGGVIHDMRCDGTLEHGVNDVRERSGEPIQVAAFYENGVHVLRPKGVTAAFVTRERVGDEIVWHYGPSLVFRMKHVEEK